MVSEANKPIALDLFCGSGAVTLGLKNAGFDVVGAVDFDSGACKTYRANHPEVKLIEKDIRTVSPEEFSERMERQLDLLVICAPCQPFSSQNRRKDKADSRIDLIEASIPFIKKFQPSIVFLENVPGLEASETFRSFTNWLQGKSGYSLSQPMRIDAAELGVPQRRTRMILIASREIPLNKVVQIAFTDKRTVRQTIMDLPEPPIGKANALDPLHFSRRHSPLNIFRLMHIPKDGGSRDSLPMSLQLNCHKNGKSNSFPDTYGRMRWDDVSPTLTTGCNDITRGRFAHPEQNRAITLREAARLQSFPDEYVFVGNSSQIATQIGNAVPPRMMETIANGFGSALRNMAFKNE